MNEENNTFFPKGYAVWLKKNHPKLTDQQITDFCGITQYTLNSLLLSNNATMDNPIECGQLDLNNILECEKDPQLKLINLSPIHKYEKKNVKRFLGALQNQNKLNAIVWIFHNNIDVDLNKLNKIFRSRITYLEKIKQQVIEKNLPEDVVPINPVDVDFCTFEELNKLIK